MLCGSVGRGSPLIRLPHRWKQMDRRFWLETGGGTTQKISLWCTSTVFCFSCHSVKHWLSLSLWKNWAHFNSFIQGNLNLFYAGRKRQHMQTDKTPIKKMSPFNLTTCVLQIQHNNMQKQAARSTDGDQACISLGETNSYWRRLLVSVEKKCKTYNFSLYV